MGIISNILRKLQEQRLSAPSKTVIYSDEYIKGFIDGISKSEEIIFAEQNSVRKSANGLWYTGSPNDIKPFNRGSYILIMRAGFDSDDGIKKGDIKIDVDFWDGENWESFETGEDKWEVLYFTKLKWIKFPLPKNLGVRWSDEMFFD